MSQYDELAAERARLLELGYMRCVYGTIAASNGEQMLFRVAAIEAFMREMHIEYVDLTDSAQLPEIWVRPQDWADMWKMRGVLEALGIDVREIK